MGLDNVVNLNIAAVIAESDLGSVSRDIDREAGALQHVKILNDVASSFEIKRFCWDVIGAPSQNQAHTAHEFDRIVAPINLVSVCGLTPADVCGWLGQVSQIPNLDSLAPSAAASRERSQIRIHIDGVSTSLSSIDLLSALASTRVPKLDRLVPRSRVDQIRVERIEFDRKDLVFVGIWFCSASDHLDLLKRLVIVNFNLRKHTGDSDAFAISRVVTALILVLRVKENFLIGIIHTGSPSQDRSIAQTSDHALAILIVQVVEGPPSESSDGERGSLFLLCCGVGVKLVEHVVELS